MRRRRAQLGAMSDAVGLFPPSALLRPGFELFDAAQDACLATATAFGSALLGADAEED